MGCADRSTTIGPCLTRELLRLGAALVSTMAFTVSGASVSAQTLPEAHQLTFYAACCVISPPMSSGTSGAYSDSTIVCVDVGTTPTPPGGACSFTTSGSYFGALCDIVSTWSGTATVSDFLPLGGTWSFSYTLTFIGDPLSSLGAGTVATGFLTGTTAGGTPVLGSVTALVTAGNCRFGITQAQISGDVTVG